MDLHSLRPLIVVPLLVVACRAGDRIAPVTFLDSASVTIVRNRGPEQPLGWVFDQVGTVEGGSENGVDLSSLTEYTVDADTMGHIYVIDSWFGQRVQVLDTDGQLLRVLTRKGEGPGEVGEGVSISASPDGVLAVTDFTKNGIVRVRFDGAVLPLLRLTGYDLFGGARVSADTIVLHTLDFRERNGAEAIRYRTDHDTVTLVLHIPPRLGWLPFCNDGMEGLTPMLTPDLRWTARGGRVIVHHTAQYRIDDFRAGRFVRSIRRDVQGRPGNVESVRRFYPEGRVVGSRSCTVTAAELVAKRGVAPTVQPIRRLSIDLEGRIWAEQNAFPDEAPRTDVFDSLGRYLGTLRGFGAPLAFPARDLLVFATADSTSGQPRLVILRRREEGPPTP